MQASQSWRSCRSRIQQVTFYDADGWILRAPVSTGVKERETPAGVFAVVEKDKDHHSSMYDDAWMPHMQRITWNGIALHGGPLPGYAASHGCVRMPYGFAEKLFEKTWIGMRVIISPNDAEPVEFSHPALFVPKAEAIAAAPAKVEALAREAVRGCQGGRRGEGSAAKAPRETASLTSSLRKLQGLKTRADAELATADKVLAAARTDEAKARAEQLKQRPPPRPRNWGRSSTPPRPTRNRSSTQPPPQRTPPRRPRRGRRTPASGERGEARARAGVDLHQPRGRRNFNVRRNTHKPAPDGGGEVFATLEVPVTIRNPDKPIGTHVFTAVARNDAAPALDGGHHRQRGRRQERARSHHHPAGCARPHRADRIAAILDRHLGRAAERRDQLSHPSLSRC